MVLIRQPASQRGSDPAEPVAGLVDIATQEWVRLDQFDNQAVDHGAKRFSA